MGFSQFFIICHPWISNNFYKFFLWNLSHDMGASITFGGININKQTITFTWAEREIHAIILISPSNLMIKVVWMASLASGLLGFGHAFLLPPWDMDHVGTCWNLGKPSEQIIPLFKVTSTGSRLACSYLIECRI